MNAEFGRSADRTLRRAPAPDFWLAAYDVSSDNRRVALSRRLEGHGHRLQYSVYGLTLPNHAAARSLTRRAASLLSVGDALLLLPICDNCDLVQLGRPYPGTPGAWSVI